MSSAAKFTQGPWRLENPRRLVSAETEKFNVLIADDGGHDDDSYVRATDADFLLMASAPDLYAACEIGYTALWAIKARLAAPRTDTEKAAMDELQRRMDVLGSALRKARGEA